MSKLHGYTTKGTNRIATITYIGLLSYIIHIATKCIFVYALNYIPYNDNYTFIPITFSVIFGLLFKIVDKYFWKWRLNPSKIPNISGKWKCTGENFKDPFSKLQANGTLTAKPQHKWEADITISQSWTSICIILSTKQSKSESLTAQIEVINDEYCQLVYTYTNTPNASANTDMRSHEGTCKILFNKYLTTGTGEYFANSKDRLSYGTMKWIKS